MKSIRVFVFLSALALSTNVAARIQTAESISTSHAVAFVQDTARLQLHSGSARRNAPDHAVLQGERAGDHPVLLGERAGDVGGTASEHLAPLILMVMAFVIAFIAACLLRNRLIMQDANGSPPSPLNGFQRSVRLMVLVSAIFAFAAALLLMNFWNYMADGHGADHGETWIALILHNHHLVEVLFSILAFIILALAALFLWLGDPVAPSSSRIFVYLFIPLFLLTCFFIYCVVENLAQHGEHPHTIFETIFTSATWVFAALSFVAVVIGIFLIFDVLVISDKGFRRSIFFASFLELSVIVILLNIFSHHYYKLCNNNCLMNGSQAGITYDQPCADNIAFMTLHHTQDLDVDDYEAYYGSAPFPLFYEYASPVAMHNPIFPGVIKFPGAIRSEPITFTLRDDKYLIDSCTLYIRTLQFLKADLEANNFSFDSINETQMNWTAAWKHSGNVYNKSVFPGTANPTPMDSIYHDYTASGLEGRVTYVTYKFVVQFLPYTNADNVTVQTPNESIEINFVLQDFHEQLNMVPAPVYVQGNMSHVLDVLFIPAKGDLGNDVIDLPDFRKNCRAIIRDAIFKEPSLKFWRKQFNFWINPLEGQALDARCGDCCHIPPTNFDADAEYISKDIDFKALLHKGSQWDFTDHCNNFFSAEMDLVNHVNERSSFLHELGHAAYGLSDEYAGGYNEEATEHLPNNWRKRKRAADDAPIRHKTEEDVKRIF